MILLMAGLDKIEMKKDGIYPDVITKPFHEAIDNPLKNPIAKVLMTPSNLKLFADVLPYAEAALGAALIVGVTTTLTAALTGFLLINLLFGQSC